jgi:hypothetical protein
MTTRKKKLPPLPKSVYFATGSVPVKRVKGLQDREKASGMFHWNTREIWIDAELGLHAAWLTLEHEKFHVVMMDAGIELDEYVTERLCDTFALARVAEMQR